MNKNGVLESVVWPGCMWVTHAFVALLMFLVLVRAVPQFIPVLQDFDAELPRVTLSLIILSDLVVDYWYLILFPLAVIDAGILFGLSQLPSKLRWLRGLWFNTAMVAAILFFFISVVGLTLPIVNLQGKTLILTGIQDTDTLLLHVDALTNLQGGGQDDFVDNGLGLTNLRVLDLSESDVTDAGLDRLTGLTNLESLILYDTQVTDEGVMKLQQALPDCMIMR